MEIGYELTKNDLKVFSTFVRNRVIRKSWKAIFSWRGFLLFLVYCLAFRIIDLFNLNQDAFFVGYFTSAFLSPVTRILLSTHTFLREDGMSFKHRVLSISSEGIRERSETWNSLYSWDEVESLEFREKYFFMMLEYHRGFIVPHRVFPNEADMKVYVDQAKRYLRDSSKN
ncbi:YcxB family protein [Acaryochloris marina NIES-2412]|uniref:YcxB family protein n=1 Tax=Acaryochloris marina TaxID=155978 RepID=UPI0040591B40